MNPTDEDANSVPPGPVPTAPRAATDPATSSSRPGEPRATREEQRTWVWWFLGIAAFVLLLIGSIAALQDMIGNPRTVVEATSDAIVFQPAEIIDLVQLARPRFGLYEQGRVFDGIRLSPLVHADSLLRAFGDSARAGEPDSVFVIQRFQITPGCQVSLERMFGRWLRVDIRSLQSDPALPCAVSAEVLLGRPGALSATVRRELDATIGPEHATSLQLSPLDPPRLRRFAVSGLGFTSAESSSPESSIRGAVVRLPDFGVDGDTVFFGDWLTLGALEGELTEVSIDETIRSLFKGEAAEPTIGDRRLKPSLLQQAVHADQFTVVVAIVVGFISLAMAIFQVVFKS